MAKKRISVDNNIVPVLDHGYVKLLNLSGPTRRRNAAFDADCIDPANSARMSFDKKDSGRTRKQDLDLLGYLIKNNHNTPLEMIECWFEMKLPIFIARQFVRHRTATLNEVSARYTTLEKEWYVPASVGGSAPDIKQGQVDNLPECEQDLFRRVLDNHCEEGYLKYNMAIERGVAKEHARLLLSVNHYTKWLWKQDLSNLLHFIKLREHPHAQIESQMYARAIKNLLIANLPDLIKKVEELR